MGNAPKNDFCNRPKRCIHKVGVFLLQIDPNEYFDRPKPEVIL